jgi:hypothetical protein
LKAGVTGSLKLTFSGGDMLFSSVIASQVLYVKYTQGQNQTTVTGAVCSDPLDTVTFMITPAVKEDLTIQVKLIGPDGTIGSEITNTVPVSQFETILWNPSRITTALWLDASDSTTLTTVSGYISEWRDKSGNSRNAVQSTDNYRPSTSTLNNLTILTFDGINDNMNIPTTILQSQSKPNIFYVFVPNNNNSYNGYSPEITFNSTNNGDNGSFHYVKSNLLGASYPMYTAGGWGNYENAGSGYVYGSSEMISFITLTSTYNVYRNGILEGSSSAGNVLSYSTGLQLAQQQGSRTSGISFAEIVLVFGDSTDTYQRIEGYLAWKWGLVSKLPITHPYKSAKP